MEEFYSKNQGKRLEGNSHILAGNSNVRYGKHEGGKERFDALTKIENKEIREKLIDDYLDELEDNSQKNGFMSQNYSVIVADGPIARNSFKIDDRSIYYNFFEKYREMRDKYEDKSPNLLYRDAIINTVQDYFGAYNGNHALRQSLTENEFVENENNLGDFEFASPSISKQKGLGCAECVEKASVAHNLFLLGGYESYYVMSSSVKLKDFQDEGHAYCFVNYDNSFKMLDLSMKRAPAFKEGENPVEDILNGKPFVVGEDVYANAFNLNKEMEEEA